jgi:citronellol/citronellal dehydrogenase
MINLKGKTLFITGASRGIGKAIGLRAADDAALDYIATQRAKVRCLSGSIRCATRAARPGADEAGKDPSAK